MKQQFANGLRDTYHQISARNILQNKLHLTFTEFRTEMSLILRSRAKRPKTVQTNAVESVEIKEDDEPPKHLSVANKEATLRMMLNLFQG